MKKKIKILFPIGAFHPARTGGPSKSVYWHVNAMDNDKFTSTVLTTDCGMNDIHIDLNKRFISDYGSVIYYKTRFHYLPLRMLANSILELKAHKIIHLTEINYPPSILLSIFAIIKGKTVVWSVRGGIQESAINSGKKTFKSLRNILVRKYLAKHVTFHSTSKAESKQIVKYFQPKNEIILLPNYIKVNDLEPKFIKKEKFILYLGRVSPIKSLETFLESLSNSNLFLSSKFKFLIAGDNNNEYGRFLAHRIKVLALSSKVEFVGRIDGIRKMEFLQKAYCLVLPSKSENFGNVVVESLISGTPVISTRGTPWRNLEIYNSGYWVERTPKDLQEALEKLLRLSKERYKEMCINAINYSKEFDVKYGIKNWETLYEKLSNPNDLK